MNSRDLPSVPSDSATTQPRLPHDSLVQWLIRSAASRLPADLSARLEEEWLAHLSTLRASPGRLYFALGCCWAGRMIAHEALAAVAARAAPNERTLAMSVPPDSGFSHRTAVLLAIVALHAIALYGFTSGFARDVIARAPGVLMGHMLPTLPPPPPEISSPRRTLNWSVVPIPDFSEPLPHVQFPTEISPPSGEDSGVPPTPPQSSLLPHPRQYIIGGPGKGFPQTADFYPNAARRAGAEGISTVRVCVEPDGQLRGAPTLLASSGSLDLDASALALARAGSGHYRSSTEDGRPVEDCYAFRVRFQLRQ